VRGIARWHEHDRFKLKLLKGTFCQHQMTYVNGIKSSSHNSYAMFDVLHGSILLTEDHLILKRFSLLSEVRFFSFLLYRAIFLCYDK
jgi:hypothetical protein